LVVTISLELTTVSPDLNIFSKNLELTSTFFNLQSFGPSPLPNLKKETHNIIIMVITTKRVRIVTKLEEVSNKYLQKQNSIPSWRARALKPLFKYIFEKTYYSRLLC